MAMGQTAYFGGFSKGDQICQTWLDIHWRLVFIRHFPLFEPIHVPLFIRLYDQLDFKVHLVEIPSPCDLDWIAINS